MFNKKQPENPPKREPRPIYSGAWGTLVTGGITGSGGSGSSGTSYSEHLDYELKTLIDNCGITRADDLIELLKKLPEVQEGLKRGAMAKVLEKEKELEQEKARARKVGADV